MWKAPHNSFQSALISATVFSLIATCHPFSHAQTDTALRSFFPTEIGNYWEYMDEDFPNPTLHYSFRVERDTLMPNDRTYLAFAFGFIGQTRIGGDYDFYRIDDSLRVYKYLAEPSCEQSEYQVFDLRAVDRSLWPVCLDWIPGGQQEYIGLYSTQEDFFPHLQLDTVSKYYVGATIDSPSGDTLWNSGLIYGYSKKWLARGLGLARIQGEAGPPVYLMGAIINGRRYGTITSINEHKEEQSAPDLFCLHQNFPNPFNSTTQVNYQVPNASNVSIRVYNSLGQEVAMLVDKFHSVGYYRVRFNASNLASGVYIYQLQANHTTLTNKMILIR